MEDLLHMLLGLLMTAGVFVFPLMIVFSIFFPKAAVFWMRKKTKKKAITLYSSLCVSSLVLAIIVGTTSPTMSASVAVEPLTSSTFEGEWPFSVDGEIRCISQGEDLGYVILKTDSSVYALNGLARESNQYSDIFNSAVWKQNSDLPGTKINIGPIISAGLKRCR